MAAKLNKTGFDRFVKTKAQKFVGAAMEAARDELSGRNDLDIKLSGVKASANIVSAQMTVRSETIMSEELGTELEAPAHTVGRLIKDPSVRNRIIRKAAASLK